jgi:hypothetical protein
MRKSGAHPLGDALPYSFSFKEENVFYFLESIRERFSRVQKIRKEFKKIYPADPPTADKQLLRREKVKNFGNA